MDKLQEIREALERVEEGLWIPQDDCPNCRGKGHMMSDTEAGREFDECYCLIPENRMFNANAPECLSYLLSELDHARGCAEDAWKKEDVLEAEIESLQQQLDSAKQENTELQAIVDHQGISILERREQIETLKQGNERLSKKIAELTSDHIVKGYEIAIDKASSEVEELRRLNEKFEMTLKLQQRLKQAEEAMSNFVQTCVCDSGKSHLQDTIKVDCPRCTWARNTLSLIRGEVGKEPSHGTDR